MTMQTTTLPFQVSGASALGQPQRNAAAGVQAADDGQFSATLSRAMAPTTAPSAAPTAAPTAGPNKNATPARQTDKPAAQAPKTAAREQVKQNDAAPDAPEAPDASQGAAAAAETAASAADPAKEAAVAAENASAAATAAAEAATTPVTDMLAFMASLMQPAPAAPVEAAPVAAEAAAVPVAAGGAELQLAALQSAALESAFAKLDSADGATAADPGLAAATEGDTAAAGFSLAAGVQPAAQDSADLRSVQQTAQAAVQADAGKLQQGAQARESGAQALAAVEAPAPAPAQLQAQAAKLEAMANPAAVPGDRIPARVGTQAWDNQVSQRIVYMVGKEQAATLTLNPPDLGPVQVVLNVSNEGASVAFSSNQQEVRQALENALPRLREMMSESGIALGNATVDAGMPDGRQAQQDGERRNNGGGGVGNGAGTVAANDEGAARPATRTVALGDNGLVDTFA